MELYVRTGYFSTVVKKIIWSDKSGTSYFKILDFLILIWNEDIWQDFISLIDEMYIALIKNPQSGKITIFNIGKILLRKNAKLYDEDDYEMAQIKFLLFKDNRQNPESYLKLL